VEIIAKDREVIQKNRPKFPIRLLVIINGVLLEAWGNDSFPTHSRIYQLLNELKKFEDIDILSIRFPQRPRDSIANCIYNNIIKSYIAIKYLYIILLSSPIVYFEYPFSMTVMQNRMVYWFCVLMGTKIVLDVHDTLAQSEAIGNGKSSITYGIERYCLKNATLISFSLNFAMWSQLAEMYQVSKEKKVVFVPNAFENSFMKMHEKPVRSVPGRFSVCYIGGISKNRGVDLLVSACYNLHGKYPYLKLYIFGEYGEGFSRQIMDIIEESDFITRLIVKRKDLPAMVKDMDIFFMPYNPNIEYTNLCSPTKFFEYMATGKPIISTRCRSILDIARGGVIYADYSVKDFEDKIERLITDEELREKLSAEQVEQRLHHTWRERAEKIHDALLQI